MARPNASAAQVPSPERAASRPISNARLAASIAATSGEGVGGEALCTGEEAHPASASADARSVYSFARARILWNICRERLAASRAQGKGFFAGGMSTVEDNPVFSDQFSVISSEPRFPKLRTDN